MFCVILRQEPANIRAQLGFMEKNAICVGTHCISLRDTLGMGKLIQETQVQI